MFNNKKIQRLENRLKKLEDLLKVDGEEYMNFTNQKGIYGIFMPLNMQIILTWFIELSKVLKLKCIRGEVTSAFQFKKTNKT